MGNNAELKQWDIKFVQKMDDQHFGNIDIYKNQSGKHVMMLRRTFVRNGDDRPINDFMEFLNYAKEEEGLNTRRCFQQGDIITPILHTDTITQNNLCIVYEIVDTYCQYFNFTLMDMIRHKKEMDIDQLWLCFHWLTKLANLLKTKNWKLQKGIDLDCIFITLKGQPTVSIHHLLKIREDDIFMEGKCQRTVRMEQVARCVLQLLCMVEIGPQENCELYLRKCEKADPQMGKLISKILRKSLRKSEQWSEESILQEIQQLLENKQISKSREIRLNKFKYIIPKPTTNQQKYSQQPPQKQQLPQKIQSINHKAEESQKPIPINSLQGRKSNRGPLSSSGLRESHKRSIISILDPHCHAKAASLKVNQLASQIENRKKMNQKQWEKLSERKQIMMKSELKDNPSRQDKQNILGNSIREVKPSLNRKELWSRRIMNEQMKCSKRKC